MIVPLLKRASGAPRLFVSNAGFRQFLRVGFRSSSTATATVPEPQPVQENTSHEEPTDVPYSTIANSISPGTFKALTQNPFNFEAMTDIQSEVFKLLPDLALSSSQTTKPRDILARAKTGTGKTVAFLVPAVESRLKVLREVGNQAAKTDAANDSSLQLRAENLYARENIGTLILTPTRELALQIAKEATSLTKHHKGFSTHVWIGAMPKQVQMRDFMRSRRDIVVATPGRLRDLVESEPDVKAALRNTTQVILDEADTMLEIGFRDDIDAVLKYLPQPPKRQTLLFSATIPSNVKDVINQHLAEDYVTIDCVKEETSPVHADIPQYSTVLPSAAEQIPHIFRLIAHDQLTNPGASKVILFLPTTKMTQLFTSLLQQFGRTLMPAQRTKIWEIHSKRAQTSRSRTSEMFRNDKSGASVLVTSDVSARGVDYPGVTRVIQVGVPSSREQYIHRVGRTGRGLKTIQGRGDFVVLPWEVGFLSWQLSGIPIKPLKVSELKAELTEMTTKQVAAPPGFFQSPLAPVLDEIDRVVTDSLAPRINEEEVREVYTSLLGYYTSRASDLRISGQNIANGLSEWTTQALGLAEPPRISPALLQKLGLGGSMNNKRREWTNRSDGQRRSDNSYRFDGHRQYDSRQPRTQNYSGQQPRWMGRGSHVSRDHQKQAEWERQRSSHSREGNYDRQSRRSSYSRDRDGSSRMEWKAEN